MIDTKDIFQIIAKEAETDAAGLTLDTKLADLYLQSIDMVELVFAIEDQYDIEIPYSPNPQNSAGVAFEAIGDIVAAVDKLVAEQHAATA